MQRVHTRQRPPGPDSHIGGSRYFITFIDDFSKWTVADTMHRKSDSLSCFKKYHKYAEAHTGAKVKKINVPARSRNWGSRLKALRTDNGGEYLSTELKKISLRERNRAPTDRCVHASAERSRRTDVPHSRRPCQVNTSQQSTC